jgi:tellurite resistance protein TerC/cation:H+ antiporter
MHELIIKSLRQARRAIVAVVGFTVIGLGVVIIATPGPGWLVIFLGLSLLAAEFVWARHLLKRLKASGEGLRYAVFGGNKKGRAAASMPPTDAPRKAL